MLKAHAKLIHRFAIATDIAIFLLALSIACYYARVMPIDLHFATVSLVGVLALFSWFYLARFYGIYHSLRKRSRLNLIFSIGFIQLLIAAFLTSFSWLFVPEILADGFLTVFLGVAFALLMLERLLVRMILGIFRRFGFNTRNYIAVGLPERVAIFLEKMANHQDWGYVPLGMVTTSRVDKSERSHSIKILGRAEDLVIICLEKPVDEVFLCMAPDELNHCKSIIDGLKEIGASVRLVLEDHQRLNSDREMKFLCGDIPLLTLNSNKFDSQWIFLKRALDLLGSLVGMLLLVLVFPFVALAIKLESRGPIFFSQQRIGMNGRPFRIWKFRSMFVDAEKRKRELQAHNEMKGPIFKIAKDPRITSVGRFLRRTSLDEFPQFWNVFKGDMSLVGTRPPTPDEVFYYKNWHRRRISIKPGLTGVWQVSGRNKVNDFDDIVKLDLNYIDHWNPWLDLKIICQTIPAVISRNGSS